MDKRDWQRLPLPANRRFWTIGVVASVAFHVIVFAIFWVSIVRDGNFVARTRLPDSSPLADQITLLDIPDAAASGPAVASTSKAAPSAAPAASPATSTAASPVTTSVKSLTPFDGARTPTAATGAAVPISSGANAVDFAALGSDYRRRLLEHIAAHRQQPPPGTPRGTVYVNFTLTRAGGVQSAAIAVSSGNVVLDRAALDSIQSASPMPVIPVGFPDPLTVMLPIDFRIDQVQIVSRP